ncbi:MAG: TRAP transporter small permease [Synergistaceae bacterium]|jgi:C4-dicarboxylate transporter DctQ subunit|nr:TRAP transporter small permease [Synergistaceae bacterium]
MSENSPETPLMWLSGRVNVLCEGALFVTLSLMTAVTILQIVCRLLFKALTWSEELNCFLLVFASFFGVCVAFRRGANITVNFLRDALPPYARRVVLMAAEVTGIVFFAAVGWYGAVLCVNERFQTASSMPISISWMYLVFPLTSAVTILHLCARLYGMITRRGEEEAG